MLSLQSISLTDLLLSCLLFAEAKGLATSALKRASKPLAGSEQSGSAFTEKIDKALTALSAQNNIQLSSRSRYKITETGHQYLLDKLGLPSLPLHLRWNSFKNADWIAYALKLPALSSETRKLIAEADGLRAAILKQAFTLPVDDFASLTEARNALLWQQLCDPATATNLQQRLPTLRRQAFNQGTVMSALLNDLLQTAKPLPWEKALPQLVAKVANAKRTSPEELRVTILRQALTNTPVESEMSAPQVKEQTLSEFAQVTLQAAKATKNGRLGDNKVFISAVWETLHQSSALQISLHDFKQHLLAANQQQLLTLSRADMSYALDPEAVSASELTHMNSTFHFIRLD